MNELYNEFYPIEKNQIVFRTKPGALFIPAGETIRLTADGGIPVANFYTIRMYARTRQTSTVPVNFYIHVLDKKEDELIFLLDRFTLQSNEDLIKTYDVPGPALVVFAEAGPGTGGTYIDFGILGFGRRVRAFVL